MEAFTTSPFLLTATPETGATWAGRSSIRAKIQRLVRTLAVRPDSTLDVIWANFGSGKSHALFHIAHLIQQHSPDSITTFVEVPEQVRSFVDLYRRIMPKLPWKRLAFHLNHDANLPETSSLKRAARVLEHGNEHERSLALQWVLAGTVNLRDLKTFVGVQARIESDVQAADLFSELLGSLARHKIRFVLLLDEFQRIGSLQEKYRWPVLSNLRSLFSQNPTYFSVVIAAATRMEKTAMDLLPAELRTLIGPRLVISLPEMNTEEALEFVEERLKQFRATDYSGDSFHPLQRATVEQAIAFIANETNSKLIPRTILQALAALYDEYLIAGELASPAAALQLLKSLSWDGADGHETS